MKTFVIKKAEKPLLLLKKMREKGNTPNEFLVSQEALQGVFDVLCSTINEDIRQEVIKYCLDEVQKLGWYRIIK